MQMHSNLKKTTILPENRTITLVIGYEKQGSFVRFIVDLSKYLHTVIFYILIFFLFDDPVRTSCFDYSTLIKEECFVKAVVCTPGRLEYLKHTVREQRC